MAKNTKNKNKTTPPVKLINWYYMCPAEITVTDLQAAISDCELEIEIWPEAGVLEVVVEEKQSMDIEQCELDLGDEFSNNYLAECQTKTLFYITYKAEIDDRCQLLLRAIVEKHGGRVCADTDDFTPLLKL